MSETSEQIEKRAHPRYPIQDYMFISNTSKNGSIIDLSMGGIAFHYIEKKTPREETIKFGTLIGNDFCLSQIPLEVANQTRYVEDDVVRCRCGLKFGNLLSWQKKKLQQFLATKTLEQAGKMLLY